MYINALAMVHAFKYKSNSNLNEVDTTKLIELVRKKLVQAKLPILQTTYIGFHMGDLCMPEFGIDHAIALLNYGIKYYKKYADFIELQKIMNGRLEIDHRLDISNLNSILPLDKSDLNSIILIKLIFKNITNEVILDLHKTDDINKTLVAIVEYTTHSK